MNTQELFEFQIQVRDQIWHRPLRFMSEMFSNPIGTKVKNSVKSSVYVHIIDSVRVSFEEVNECARAKLREYDFRRT